MPCFCIIRCTRCFHPSDEDLSLGWKLAHTNAALD